MSERLSPWNFASAVWALVAGIAMMAIGSYVVIYGLEADWPTAIRAVAGFIAFQGLGVALAAAHRLTGVGQWVTDRGQSFERCALLFPVVAVASVAVPALLAKIVGIWSVRGIFFGCALASASMALTKPWWFWNHPEVEAWRSIFGNRAVAWLYYAFAIFFAWFSIAVDH